MMENATRVCDAEFGTMLVQEGGAFRHVAHHHVPPEFADLMRRDPVFQAAPDSPLDRVVRTKQAVHVADLKEEPAYLRGAHILVRMVQAGGVRTMVNVPMLKDDELIGAITIYRQEVQLFTEKQIALVSNFAKQAVIAIENTRLLNELRESLQQQTATSEVLEVISSSPGELEPVFTKMLDKATRICDAKFGILDLCEGDAFRAVALHGAPPAYAEARRREPIIRPKPGGNLDRLARTKQVVHIADVLAEKGYDQSAIVDSAEARTVLIIPMLKEDELIGGISIYRQEVRPFTDKQIALVENFAKQAVIAIENARLLKELRQRTADLTESLEQQTATSEVLQVISNSPGELDPVFNTALTNATRICEAKFGMMFRFDGEAFHFATEVGTPREFAEFERQRGPFLSPRAAHSITL